MHEKLRQHINELFENAPKTARMAELKEEMLQNLTEKYEDLLREGKGEDAAYNIAVASIGDVSSLIQSEGAKEQFAKESGRSALLTALAVVVYILCVIPVILLQNELGVVLMFVLIAAATGLLIWNGSRKERYVRSDDTMVEEFKEWRQGDRRNKQTCGAITGAIWMLAVCGYLALSFLTHAWHITWLIYPIAGAVCMVVRGIFDLKQ